MCRQGYSPRQLVQIFQLETSIAFFLLRTILSSARQVARNRAPDK